MQPSTRERKEKSLRPKRKEIDKHTYFNDKAIFKPAERISPRRWATYPLNQQNAVRKP
jgi:hypothetical protein